MTETVNSRTLRFVKGNRIVMADEKLIGMTPLSGSELMEAGQYEFVDLYTRDQLSVSEVWPMHEDTRLALFDRDRNGVLVFRGDLGTDPDLFNWEVIRIYML